MDSVRETSILLTGYIQQFYREYIWSGCRDSHCTVSTSGYVSLCCTSVIQPLKYRARKHNPQQVEKQKTYINMKLKNMPQNDQCVTKMMKKKIKSLLVKIDATAWLIKHWINDNRNKNINAQCPRHLNTHILTHTILGRWGVIALWLS